MDRLILSIVLQYQYARTFVVGWIIFDNYGLADPGYDVVNEDIILGQLVAAMIRRSGAAKLFARHVVKQPFGYRILDLVGTPIHQEMSCPFITHSFEGGCEVSLIFLAPLLYSCLWI